MASKAAELDGRLHRHYFPAVEPGNYQTLNIGAAATVSQAFDGGTTIVRVCVTVDAFVDFGKNPTASSSKLFIPGGAIEYFCVGNKYKISVIAAGATTGKAYISEGV